MALINVGVLGTGSINQSGSDSVNFVGVGTLDIAGPPGPPITVDLTQIAGVGVLDTINITNATVTVGGVANVSALLQYNIGAGGTLILDSAVGVAAGTAIDFTAVDSRLVLGPALNLTLLGSISGFGPGSSIDVPPAAASLIYTDAPGANTGGVITLYNSSNQAVDTITLNTGDFTTSSFRLSPDGTGGTIIGFTGVTGITASPTTADLGVGQMVAFTVTTNDTITVASGSPTLTLSDGGTATYNAGASTPSSLVFNYTVAPGQNSPDLTVTGDALNGATVTDSIGNPVDLSPAIGNPPGILQIDTTPPTITSVTATPTSGDLGAGQTVTFTVTTSEPVAVTGGTPTLTLSDGGTAIYNPGASTPGSLAFTYIVAAGQNAVGLAITGDALNGATIADGAGNPLDLTPVLSTPTDPVTIDTTPPTITSVTATPTSGDLGAGQTVTFTVTTSEPVAVTGGTPTLTLSDGGTAIYNPGASTPGSLAFTYIVAAGQNAVGLAITGDALNGATIADGAGNPLDLTPVLSTPTDPVTIDTTPPTITSVTATPTSGDLGAGQTVTFTVTTSEPVAVTGGTPTLTLSDGGTAIYNPGASTPGSLAFTYIVAAGQNAVGLAITGDALNGATIADGAGNPLDLTPVLSTPTDPVTIDTTPPTITSVTATPTSGDLGAGQTVTFTVTTSEPVAVTGGTPTLTLSDGGTAIYNPGASTPGSLAFTYIVAAGQNAVGLAITGDALNGATIADGAGNPLDLTPVLSTPTDPVTIDTTPPTITSVTATPTSGDLGAGQTVTFTVTTSEPVAVTGGTPTLTLSDGGTAIYNPGASTPGSLAFTYIVAAGQNAVGLAITGDALNGATIADGAGNPLDLTPVLSTPTDPVTIDTTPPTITSVTATPTSGDLGAGQTVTFTVTTSEPVAVTGGTPTLTLSDGGTAIYNPGASTPGSLAFTYIVAAGQNAVGLAITGDALNGATIADGAGNPLDLTPVLSTPTDPVTIDTTPPTITSVTATPTSGDLGAGQTVTFTVTTSEPVAVTGGTPTLTLSDGGTAIYNPGASTPGSLAFTYIVAAGDNAPDLAITGASSGGATITDAAGNEADLAGAVVNPAGILQIDTTPPTVAGVMATPSTGDLDAGNIVSFSVTMTEPVTVTGGTPTLILSDGATAFYDAAVSTPTSLVFVAAVTAGQNSPDLAIAGSSLNGATITDGAGNEADLIGVAINPPETLQIDTTPPAITSVNATPSPADVGASQPVTFTVTTSEPVIVTGGTPTLTLSDGGIATYNPAASSPASLAFTYIPSAGQNASNLSVTGESLNGATIADNAGNPLDLTSLQSATAVPVQVDTTPPSITSVTANPSSGAVGIGQTVTFTASTTEPVSVTGGMPALTLSDGGTAAYSPTASTPTALAFVYSVAAGDSANGLTVTGDTLNGAAIADGAGNPLDLSAVTNTPAVPVQIDGIAPIVTGVSQSPGDNDITAGQPVTFTVGSSQPVTVTGVPSLALNNGGMASYEPGASTPTSLAFSYTLPAGSPVPGQGTGDLAITGVNLNGGSITDSASNALVTSGAVGGPPQSNNFAVQDVSNAATFTTAGDTYTGPVEGLDHQYINLSPDNLNITALVPNSFIHSGAGEDAIDVSHVNGNNVLDGSTGSNFLVGGTGTDVFFVDDRVAAADIWSTVANFHSGDAVTLYGITQNGFSLNWSDNQGAAGLYGPDSTRHPG